jgi:acyl dehydratase
VKSFEQVNIGDTIGPLDITVTKEQCRDYAQIMGVAGIAGRFTDEEAAKKEGLPGIILPGNMSLGLLAKLVTDWIGMGKARMTRIGTTYRQPVQPDRAITIQGFVTNTDPAERTAEIELWIENEDSERLVIGTATVTFDN